MSLCLTFSGSAGLDGNPLASIAISPSPGVLYMT